jgi:UDP-GlcNAc3NAcA epimerase
MSDIFFEELAIPKPDYSLGVGSGSHRKQTGEILAGVEEVPEGENRSNLY